LPLYASPALHRALERALQQGQSPALQAVLTDLFRRDYRLPPEVAPEAAALYLRLLLGHLWRVAALRDALRDVLAFDAWQNLQALAETLEDLPQRTAQAVLRARQEQARARASEQLQPAQATFEPAGRRFSFHELKAQYRLVPFVGQAFHRLRDDLAAWAQNLARQQPPLGLRWLYGPGGAGKTRLLVEVAAALQEEGWQVAFLPREPWDDEALPFWVAGEDKRPRLLIADYAELRPAREVTALLQAAVQAAPREAPLALVLLTRQGPQPGEAPTAAGLLAEELTHWATTPAAGPQGEAFVQEGLRTARPIPRLQPPERVDLFARARQAFRLRLEVAPATPAVDVPADALPERPLPLVLLAFLAAQGHRLPRTGDEEAIYRAAWAWERSKWAAALEALGGPWREPDLRHEALNLVEAARLAATLGRPFADEGEVVAFWARLQGEAGLLEDRDLKRLARALPRLLVGRSKGLAPEVEPDPLADFLLAQRPDLPALARAALPTVEELLQVWAYLAERLAEAQDEAKEKQISIPTEEGYPFFEGGPRLLAVLERLRERYPEAGRALAEAVEVWLPETAGRLPAEAARLWLEVWVTALPDHPERTVALREAVAGFYQAQTALTEEGTPEHLAALGNWANALSALGRRRAALQVTRQVYEGYRRLAEQNPQAFEPDLAMSLNNLANRLAEVGQRRDALRVAQEAADLYRDLAAQNPQAFLPDLAGSLNNLGTMLGALGRREEALAATQEAADLYRDLAAQNPRAFLPDLATSLNNLGSDLSALGRREEALRATQEAVEIRRDLAAQNPQAFLPDLAGSLNNLGAMLSDLGRREEALRVTREAVDLYRKLAAQNPQAFLPDLARSLTGLGVVLSALGRREEALAATQEAADLYRDLAAQNPQAFLPDLAMSLGAHGYALLQAGRPREAADAFREGLRTLLPFTRALPQAYGGLLQALLEYCLRAAQAAGQAPEVELVREAVVAVGAQGLVPLLEWVETATHGERPLESEIAHILQGVAQDEQVPPPLRTLAQRLLAVLQGERDPEKLLAGLDDETFQQNMRLLLARLQGEVKTLSLEDLFRLTEEAARSERPLESEIARVLQGIAQDAQAPPPLRALAQRLLAVLQGERDPQALTQGLEQAEALSLLVLLGRLRDEQTGALLASLAAAIPDFFQGVERAREYLAQLRDAYLQSESEADRAFGRALQALLAGERDPERLLQGWGEDEPLLAAILRLLL